MEAHFERAWYVKPFAGLLFGDAPPFTIGAAPDWLRLGQHEARPSVWTLDVAAADDATRARSPGEQAYLVPLSFPWRPAAWIVGCRIALHIEAPRGPLSIAPATTIVFEGPRGGPFHPRQQRLTLSNPSRQPAEWRVAGVPDWLHVSPAAGRLRQGDTALVLTLGDPARRLEATTDGGFRVLAADIPVAVRVVIDAPPETSTIDDVVCDRLAGNRFDPDHPADRGHQDETSALSSAEIDQGLAACDPSTARRGPDRRFAVQRARLLAERALRRVASGDVAGAQHDMDEAVGLWRLEAAAGSAYAENFLGAYYKGTFNRSEHAFVTPDSGEADAHWLKAMQGGSIIGQRNYAAQLLSGNGVTSDPPEAMRILQAALDKGDVRAAGIMGVALYTGFPLGIVKDKTRGWSLITQAQCVDGVAKQMLDREIDRGLEPSADRHGC